MTAIRRVLLAFNTPYPTPRGYDFREEFADPDNMYTERDVFEALSANGYEVRRVGVYDDIAPLLQEIEDFRPDVVFNMVEVFRNRSSMDAHVGALLELLGVPYTGAGSGSLHLCNDKALSKKILRYHRLRVARFQTFLRGERVRRSAFLHLPAVVKPLTEEASRGISRLSVVESDEALVERVRFIHTSMDRDAIVEEYIEGRELYVSVLGRRRLTVLPPREMIFGRSPADEPRIATYKAKWDDAYRERWGIRSAFAGRLPAGAWDRIVEVCKRAYRVLGFRSYVRFDVRLTPQGRVYVIEANANPCLARIDEVAQSARKAGIEYNDLIRRIVRMALPGE